MKRTKLTAVLLLAAAAGAALAQGAQQPTRMRVGQVQVETRGPTVYQGGRLELSGPGLVVRTQDARLEASRVILIPGKQGYDRAEATGNVRIFSRRPADGGTMTATGQRAVYQVGPRRVVLTGSVTVTTTDERLEGPATLQGPRAEIDLGQAPFRVTFPEGITGQFTPR